MKRAVLPALAALALISQAQAAESWGLPNEELATFDGKVVDVQCALTGDCPHDCGAGKRQLGLLKSDGNLVLVMKNAVPFAGAVRDLLPYCGKSITADGVFAANEGARVFALQRLKPQNGDWIAADRFLHDWAKANKVKADSAQAEEWYKHDAIVKAAIAADGKLGLGPGVLPKE